MLKSYWWGGGVVVVVAHAIIVSAQGPNPFFSFFGGLLFDLGACWDKDLDQGLTIFETFLKLLGSHAFLKVLVNC